MNIKSAFITALRALNRNKLRSALTSIGIIIGISSVIIMVGIVNSGRIAIQKKLNTAGANAISIYSSTRPLVERDLEELKRLYPQIKYVTPQIYQSYVPTKFRNRSLTSRIYGVNRDFFYIKDWDLQYGRYFTETEMIRNDKVVVLGNTVRTELFGFRNPVGEIINITGIPFKIIGTLLEAGQSLSGRDFDNVLIMPYTTAQKRMVKKLNFDQINVATHTGDQVDDTLIAVKEYFRRVHFIPPGKPDDFKTETSKEKLKQADYIANIMFVLLTFIASISLIVGGIGIMNIMYISVSERTREIGIRMAIGAKRRDILMQFLIESVTLSSAGGVVGISFGLIIYFLIVTFVDWPFIFSMTSVIISFLFASSVGIFFGYYPAKKAANLRPIDALRFE